MLGSGFDVHDSRLFLVLHCLIGTGSECLDWVSAVSRRVVSISLGIEDSWRNSVVGVVFVGVVEKLQT